MNFNIDRIRKDFRILDQTLYNNPFVYLDNGATTQKPNIVIDAIKQYYETINANVHRGVHTLSQKATDVFEEVRRVIQSHIGAEKEHEVIFTKGTTESINLVANGMQKFITKGDEILVSNLEHHSNIVPWQMLCRAKGAKLKVIPMDDNGCLLLDEYKKILSHKTKLVAVNHISNALGIVNPIKEIIAQAHGYGAWVLIDGAQALPHLKINVKELDADFYTFSGHKMYANTGVGVLYGKEEILNDIPPYQGGGEMIREVTFEKTTYACLPFKFEAGTPNISGVISLKYAIEYMNSIGLNHIEKYETQLLKYATKKLSSIEGLNIYGKVKNKAGVLSFNIDKAHHYDVGTILDKMGIAVRTGHHCAQPVMQRLGISGTVRASLAIYNTTQDIDILYNGMLKVKQMLS